METMRKRAISSLQTPTSPIASSIQQFDAYAKTIEDFSTKTFFGGLVTIISTFFVIILIISEFWDYSGVKFQSRMSVDAKRRDLLPINFNITFPRMPCFLVSLDVMDSSGEHQSNVDHTVYKVRLEPDGTPIEKSLTKKLGTKTSNITAVKDVAAKGQNCGSCYGALENGCCNNCRDVIRAYEQKGWTMTDLKGIDQCVQEGWADIVSNQKREGCMVHGQLQVRKVIGNFHFAPGISFDQNHVHFHDLQPFRDMKFDFTHRIHELSFGSRWEGVINPLDGFQKETTSKSVLYNYYTEVVSTEVTYLNGTVLSTNQYSVTHHEREVSFGMGMVGLFFNYDISPMIIEYVQYSRTLSSFLTQVCAIVGGIYTVAGIIDSWIYNVEKRMAKKMQIGKSS